MKNERLLPHQTSQELTDKELDQVSGGDCENAISCDTTGCIYVPKC
jgi:bacteriocin-like protein